MHASIKKKNQTQNQNYSPEEKFLKLELQTIVIARRPVFLYTLP